VQEARQWWLDVQAQAQWRGFDGESGGSAPGGSLPRAGGFLGSSTSGGSSSSSSSPPFLPRPSLLDGGGGTRENTPGALGFCGCG
jgi:hypothetical protein